MSLGRLTCSRKSESKKRGTEEAKMTLIRASLLIKPNIERLRSNWQQSASSTLVMCLKDKKRFQLVST